MSNGNPIIVTKPPDFFSSHKAIIIGILSILNIIIIAILLSSKFIIPSTKQPQTQPNNVNKKTVTEDELPIKLSILQNPLIYEWKGSVEGILVAKTDTNITLEKNGKRITVTVLKNYTKFYRLPSSQELSLVDIPLNSFLRGDIIITKAGQPQLAVPGEVVGGIFHLPSTKR